MDAMDLERRLHEFANTLRRGGGVDVTNDVRKRAFVLASDTYQLLSESYESIKDKYDDLDIVVRNALDEIQEAFTEEELHVIITAMSRAVATIIKNIVSGSGM